MLEFLLRVLGSLLIFKVEKKVVDYLQEPTAYEKSLAQLKKEEWFSLLMNDYRYEHIIRYNGKVKKMLGDARAANLLVNNKEEQQKFVALVHREYARLAR